MNTRTVSVELELRFVVYQKTTLPVMASFSYSRGDPFAISIAFHAGPGEPVNWTFARDLLARGISGREGIGDVRVWPSAGSEYGERGNVVNIKVQSQFGEAHFEAGASEITDFIRHTCEIVPAGEESNHLAYESELTDLLRQGL